jgi:hypothetical protein
MLSPLSGGGLDKKIKMIMKRKCIIIAHQKIKYELLLIQGPIPAFDSLRFRAFGLGLP